MIAGGRLIAIACAVAICPVAVNLAAGGLHYKPAASADPCQPRTWAPTHSTDDVLTQVALSAIDGAACNLHVSPETLGLALTSQSQLDAFQAGHHLSTDQIDTAARAGLERAVDDGERSGALDSITAFALRFAAREVPVNRLLQLVRDYVYG